MNKFHWLKTAAILEMFWIILPSYAKSVTPRRNLQEETIGHKKTWQRRRGVTSEVYPECGPCLQPLLVLLCAVNKTWVRVEGLSRITWSVQGCILNRRRSSFEIGQQGVTVFC